jgi:hypothetical protein
MRQIDIMVNAKKVEWDSQLHVLHLQLDKKKKEAGILKIEVGAKMQEVYTTVFLFGGTEHVSPMHLYPGRFYR